MTQVNPEGAARPPLHEQEPASAVTLRWALFAVAISLALYLRTLAPDVLPGDAGEFQFAAWRLGLAHATGYPTYLLLGWAWQHLLAVVGIAPATAMNALSAVAGSVGVGLIYLFMARQLRGLTGAAGTIALYSAALLAVNTTYWSQALIAEVYTLQVVLMLVLLFATQRLAEAATPRRLITLTVLAGLALTHHAMSALLLPALLVYLLVARTAWQRLPVWSWVAAVAAGALPLLLYLYIPLRSGPDASPWYHQPLGDGVLTLYAGGWDAFVGFISGRSISVGFYGWAEALAQVRDAGWLWRYHFGWVGLVMMALGLVWLARRREWALLAATVGYALVQQVFNLFYAIGDILVYYIPLYVVGALWAGFGLAGLVSGRWRGAEPAGPAPSPSRAAALLGQLAALALVLWTVRGGAETATLIDQSQSRGARTQWEAILGADPAPGSILISNDRNEIVPLFYFQTVEGRGAGVTGLFPLIAPDARFTDIGATVATALDANRGQNVYLVKPMPGLDVRYRVEEGPAPLVRVVGPAASAPPTLPVDATFGPLHLLGVDVARHADGLEVAVHWRVDAPVDGDYTATVQWLAADDSKLGQHDHPAGGVFYPTSLWKAGEHLVVRHTLATDATPDAATHLLVGMYRGPEFTPLAAAITIPLPAE